MHLSFLDWTIIAAFLIVTLVIGQWASKKAGRSVKDFFLSGRDMPWWLLGVSMVATTFSADTPNLVTDIIRNNGVAGNWVWWAFLLTGMATVFIYAKLWRRSGITTDLEFYELRYGGPQARFLRMFRAVYLGVFFNVIIMATVLLAGIKIAGVMLGLSAVQTVLLVSLVTVTYSVLGGLRGVILTDFFQFFLSMAGMIAAAIYVIRLPEIGGLDRLIHHPAVEDKIHFFPDFSDPNVAIPMFFIPIAVQWWATWYPGAEPGGGGYVAQRMLSAKDEKDAIKATLLFNAAHYALRPWPWIIIALASLIVFPDLNSLAQSFPHIDPDVVQHDLAFSAMLTTLPSGLMGLVIAALISALMSTISTHLNWGASYMVNDIHLRKTRLDTLDAVQSEVAGKDAVRLGRTWTVILMILAALFALLLENALQAFEILLQIGAGTGLLFLLRWFWWRINAYSEIVAMVVSFAIALFFEFGYDGGLESWQKFCLGVAITTVCWVVATLVTKPTNSDKLRSFYTMIRPHKLGWGPVVESMGPLKATGQSGSFIVELGMMFVGSVMIYAALFGMGYLLYGQTVWAGIALGVMLLSGLILRSLWKKLN